MRKVLIVTYHFPPAVEVGGIRPAKFTKFLPEFGWRPYVLTIDERYLSSPDHDRLRDVAGAPIFRTPVWPTLPQLAVRMKHAVYPPREKVTQGGAPTEHPDRPHPESARGPLKALSSTLSRHLTSVFELPDGQVGWLLPGVWEGCRVIRREGIRIILATAPPTTAALVGVLLAILTETKLVLDLRDPWDLHVAKPQAVRTRLSDRIEQWLERWLTCSADRIITTTDHYTACLQAQFSDLPKNTFRTIWNGFDADDFAAEGAHLKDDGRFVLSYLGTLYLGRSPKELLQAIGRLIRNNRIDRNEIRVDLVGDVQEAEGIPVAEMVRQNDLSGCVRLSKAVPYKESIAQMQCSDVLLLFAPRQYYAIPGKAFEYLGAKGSILCFGDTGATADLIQETGSGIVVNPYDVDAIEAAIWKLYSSWKADGRTVPSRNFERFERRSLTQQLAAILDELAAGSPRNVEYRTPNHE